MCRWDKCALLCWFAKPNVSLQTFWQVKSTIIQQRWLYGWVKCLELFSLTGENWFILRALSLGLKENGFNFLPNAIRRGTPQDPHESLKPSRSLDMFPHFLTWDSLQRGLSGGCWGFFKSSSRLWGQESTQTKLREKGVVHELVEVFDIENTTSGREKQWHLLHIGGPKDLVGHTKWGKGFIHECIGVGVSRHSAHRDSTVGNVG